MIEHQYNDSPKWYNTDLYTPYDRFTFSNYVIRINGVIFSEQSNEFIEAVKDDQFWDKLKQ